MDHGVMDTGGGAPRGRPVPLWGKLLIVGGAGCGAVVLAGALLVLFGVYWIMAPGKQIPTTGIAGDTSEAVFHFDNADGDKGVAALVGRFFLEMQKVQNAAQRRQVPESMRWLVDMRESQSRQSLQGLSMYIPSEVTVTVEEIPGDWRRNTFVAANPVMFTNMIRMLFWGAVKADPKVKTLNHNGREYWLLGDEGALSFIGGTILYSHMGEFMPLLLDRVDGQRKGKNPARKLKKYWPGEKRWDFYALIDDRRGVLEWLLDTGGKVRSAAPAPAAADGQEESKGILPIVRSYLGKGDGPEIEEILVAVDVVSENKIAGRLVARCAGPVDALAAAAALEALRDGLWNEAGKSGMTFTGGAGATGSEATAKFQIGNIAEAFAGFWSGLPAR